MTPREELEKNITEALNEDYTGTTSDIAIGELEGFAIGKWVSVDERLPDKEKTGEWRGYAKFKNGEIDIITWYHYQEAIDIIEWLDLSLPESPTANSADVSS